jgi:hypothetical protein
MAKKTTATTTGSRSKEGPARQKLYEALYILVGSDTIDKRLTFAANMLVQLQPNQIPRKIANDFSAVRKALTTTPLSHTKSFTPRQVSAEEGEKLAQKILGMYVRLTGGL